MEATRKGSIEIDEREAEVDRLLDLRNAVERGLLTELQLVEVDAL